MHRFRFTRTHIHSWHHAYTAPFSWAGGVVHPLEDLIVIACEISCPVLLGHHPLALWILCAAFEHIRGTAKPDKALSYYHQNNACASFGSYGTGTPLSRAFYQARRCMYDTRSGCGGFRDADPMVNALAEVDGWVPTEKELIALRRGGWSWGFDFARFCPDLPAHDGWGGCVR